MDTPNLGLPFLVAAQAQKHVTHNEALRVLDALVHLAVIDRDAAAPPETPEDGDRYIVAGGGTGAWVGHDLEIAAYQDGAWIFFSPRAGWRSWIGDEGLLVVWDGSAWSSIGGGSGGDGDMLASIYDPGNVASDAFDMANMVEASDAKIMTAAERSKLAGIETGADVTDAANVAAAGALMTSGVGSVTQAYDADLASIAGLSPTNDDLIQRKSGAWTNRTLAQLLSDLTALNATFAQLGIGGATPDGTNKLAIASAASLFNHAGAGHQQKINKATAGDTASQLYQTGFSGRAEIGLTGDDDFHFKVSPDGSAWNEAILLDKDTGKVSMPAGFSDPVETREQLKIVTLSQEGYDALDPPDADTIYLIEEDA